MTKLSEAIALLERIAPTRHAESWDNVGLLVGDANQSVSRAMLCIDYTAAVAEEAKLNDCDFVIAYHPPIFKPLSRVTVDSLVFDAVRRGVAIYSPHTALDVAEAGTNDVLADVLGLVDRRPLKRVISNAKQYTLVTFAPADAIDSIARALFAAGAGHIGDYSQCSFRTPGTGTFFGAHGTNPVVGKSQTLVQQPEIKLETVVPIHRIETVLAALRASHPYEEPAFNLVQLAAKPESIGQGRIGRFAEPVPRRQLIEQIKNRLGINHVLVAGPLDGDAHSAAVGAGSCGSEMLQRAIDENADLYLTGEMRHHNALHAAAHGMTVVCTLHSHSERIALTKLAFRLRQALPAVSFQLSKSDQDPFSIL